jgi:hypothetical protein
MVQRYVRMRYQYRRLPRRWAASNDINHNSPQLAEIQLLEVINPISINLQHLLVATLIPHDLYGYLTCI